MGASGRVDGREKGRGEAPREIGEMPGREVWRRREGPAGSEVK